MLQAHKLIVEGKSIDSIRKIVETNFSQVEDTNLEYFELVDASNLMSLNNVSDKTDKAILLIAGYVGEVRLIDNLLITDEN